VFLSEYRISPTSVRSLSIRCTAAPGQARMRRIQVICKLQESPWKRDRRAASEVISVRRSGRKFALTAHDDTVKCVAEVLTA
jgi:hypothetical protein